MEVSVIIPNTNSLLIGRVLSALEQQTLEKGRFEVIVVGEDTPGLVHQNRQVSWIPTQAGTQASDKRNLGMQAAKGEIFLFLDDDCIPAPDLLGRHFRRHLSGEFVVGGAVSFRQRPLLELADNLSAFYDLMIHTPEGARNYLAAANLSVRRPAALEAGPMRPGRSQAEDLEWTVLLRTLGYQLYFDPKAVVFHYPNRNSLAKIWKHWSVKASDTLDVQFRYAPWLNMPGLAYHRSVYLLGGLGVAAWATAQVFNHPKVFKPYWYTIPLVFWTKLAWCWGAFTHFPNPTPAETTPEMA